MKTMAILVVIFSLALFSCSNEDFYSKQTFHDNILVHAVNKNKDSILIFEKHRQYVSENWNGKYVTWIDATKLDEDNNVEFKIWAHSNAGFKIYIPEKLNNSTKIEMIIDNGYDSNKKLSNKNQFRYVEDINNTIELFGHPQILKMFDLGKRYHYKSLRYNPDGLLSRETYFKENGDTSSFFIYKYDNEGNLKTKHSKYRDHFFEYYESGELRNSKLINQNMHDSIWTQSIEETKYKYDDEERVLEIAKYENNKIIRKEVSHYNKGNLIKTSYYKYQNDIEKHYRDIEYVYDNGILVQEIRINPISKNEMATNVTYRIR